MGCPAIGTEQAAAQQANQSGGCSGGSQDAPMQAQSPCGGGQQTGQDNQGGGCGGGSGPYSASAIQAIIESTKDDAENKQANAVR